MPDGSDLDGKELLTLVRSGNNPFHGVLGVNLLILEIEENLNTQVIDIPAIYKGSNSYGFHIKLSNRTDVVARLARGDVNMPLFDGFPIHAQVCRVKFEVATYELLRSESNILASRLLYHRIPVQHDGPRLDLPRDIAGHRLFLFERAEGYNNIWHDLSSEQKACLLAQAAHIRASLFSFNLPLEFATTWLRERLFEQKPELLPISVAPTREFCVALFISKIEATIRNIGDMIGWESNHVTVGPIAAAAKQSLLRLIPYIILTDGDQTSLYRLVLEHNMSITMDANGQPLVTSLYDWETRCIVPAILSDPLMAVWVDLVPDENATPSFIRVPDDATPDDRVEYMTWARQYFKVLFTQAPNYERAIQAGKDARHLWFALRDWRGDDPEGYFGGLGAWAESRMKQLGVGEARAA
ncbi:3-hydroxybutyryl-CoA dehydratase [Lasiosphaeria miniovina]|uniref:3-hydroxybutyryl-CoA dehydratase n=1 Tax=Lasiosphaeria miniovina TaxID=1954250 RepID=A0AA40DSE3_9PEZI|nr:3-hydroxybutyryl-CoA dehydratase [Lasiosphaeria miniovina]KAK0710253.1 3-hydroxybutyryl-CoA dehydratase [Lasiosphaeria miniovina]